MIKAARLSTIKFLQEAGSPLVPSAGFPLTYVDWDAHADMTSLPDGDLYGLLGLALSEHEKIHEMVFAVSIATLNDKNLFRMTDMTDLFYRLLRSEQQFALYDPNTALPVGKIVMQRGTAATPVNRVETRAVVTISATALIVPDAVFAAAN